MSEIDPVDELARQAFSSAGPGVDDRRYAEQRLGAAIAAASSAPRFNVPVVPSVAAVLAVIALVSVWVLATPSRPATAALEEIATAIQTGPVSFAPDDDFLYTDVSSRSLAVVPRDALGEVEYPDEHFAYFLVRRRETWHRADGARQVRTTVAAPEFLSPADRQVYYDAGLDERDRVGETYVETYPDVGDSQWPQDPDRLHSFIEGRMTQGRGLSYDIEYLDVALDVVRDIQAPPRLRAEALRLIGRLSEVELVDQSTDGTVTFRTRYVLNDVDTEHRFSIDREGFLIREEETVVADNSRLQLAAGTTVHEMSMHQHAIVESLPAP